MSQSGGAPGHLHSVLFVFSDPRRSGVGRVLDTLTSGLSASPASGPGAGILGAEPQPRQNGHGKIVVEVSGLFRRSTLLGLLAPAPVEFSGRACRVTEGCFGSSPGCCEAASRWCGREGAALGHPREAAHPRGPGGGLSRLPPVTLLSSPHSGRRRPHGGLLCRRTSHGH